MSVRQMLRLHQYRYAYRRLTKLTSDSCIRAEVVLCTVLIYICSSVNKEIIETKRKIKRKRKKERWTVIRCFVWDSRCLLYPRFQQSLRSATSLFQRHLEYLFKRPTPISVTLARNELVTGNPGLAKPVTRAT